MSSRSHLLAEILRCLDYAEVGVCSARVRRHDGYMAVVELELDDPVSSNAECAAAALSRLPGARRVLYRLKDGSGGVFRPVPDSTRLDWAA